jgi:hypothetical protein
MAEALAHVEKGLTLVIKLPEGTSRQQLELDLQIVYG